MVEKISTSDLDLGWSKLCKAYPELENLPQFTNDKVRERVETFAKAIVALDQKGILNSEHYRDMAMRHFRRVREIGDVHGYVEFQSEPVSNQIRAQDFTSSNRYKNFRKEKGSRSFRHEHIVPAARYWICSKSWGRRMWNR